MLLAWSLKGLILAQGSHQSSSGLARFLLPTKWKTLGQPSNILWYVCIPIRSNCWSSDDIHVSKQAINFTQSNIFPLSYSWIWRISMTLMELVCYFSVLVATVFSYVKINTNRSEVVNGNFDHECWPATNNHGHQSFVLSHCDYLNQYNR
jgi:hypothetical protein